MGKNDIKIDFVLSWVDGNDLSWIDRKNEALKQLRPNQKTVDDENDECRYRDMGLLRYWFRGVEKFAPWVNKIYLVTCGQKPEWLNDNNPKLVLINHEDYIPKEYLPTFNSNTIETNLHRIETLSEHFVSFNDDVFLLKSISPEFFFKKGEPVLPCNLNICRFYGNNNWSRICINDYCIVNDHFNIKKSIWDNREKWFSIKRLGLKMAFMNFVRYKINKTFSIYGYDHIANPHLKSTYQEVWDAFPNILDASSRSRFRSDIQVNHWLMIAWNIAKGRFYPVKSGKRGKMIHVSSNTISSILDTIKQPSMAQLCINDSFRNDNPYYLFHEIAKTFDSILPEKSSFEI